MRWTIKDILVGIVEMVAMVGLFAAIYLFAVMMCAISDKCAAYYGMIPGGSI